jgi:hypothetical protein
MSEQRKQGWPFEKHVGTVYGYTGTEVRVSYKSEAARRRGWIANRYELAVALGWPVDCVATTSELAAELRARAAALESEAGLPADYMPPVLRVG